MIRSIACVVDDDIVADVRTFEGSSRRALYDISVVRALRRLGARVDVVAATEPADRTLQELMGLRPGLVFNLAYSATPAEAAFVGALEVLGIPFTGSGAIAVGIANDKVRARQLMRLAGIPVPAFVVLQQGYRPPPFGFPPPFFVKPVDLANAAGVHAGSVVGTVADALKQARRIWRKFQAPSMCDAFVVGREFQVGLIEVRGSFQLVAIEELRFPGAPAGRGFKSEAVEIAGENHRLFGVSGRLARLPERIAKEMASICQRAAQVLDLRGYAKMDLRMDDQDRIFVLEVNANPGLYSKNNIWRRGSFSKNLRRIIAAAMWSHQRRYF